MQSAEQKFRTRTYSSATATYTETSVIDIWQKFGKYGKMKDTFRGSNLAKEPSYKVCVDLRLIFTLHLELIILNMKAQNSRKIAPFHRTKVLPVEFSEVQE